MSPALSRIAIARRPGEAAVALFFAAALVLALAGLWLAIAVLSQPHDVVDGLRLAPFRWGPTRSDVG